MKRKFLKYMLLPVALLSSLTGCGGKKETPITDKEESTIIKNAKSTDEYLNKKDYKSIAYAFIYKIKEGIKSYESETNGTVKAKVMFFDYNIKYNSVTHKSGNKFYSKDMSRSTLMNVDNEFYMIGKDKIVVSRDLKKYNVYTLEDYHKISYSMDQYTVMGYVFNDQSIIGTEVVSDKGEDVAIKYTLDNELATNLVKVDMKCNGGLSSYPTFQSINITLTMKRDFTPVSYAINAVYDASKPVIGTTRATQAGECKFSKANEEITIPNETFLADKLGMDPSRIVVDDKEQAIKDELLGAVKNLDFAHGVNVKGNVTLSLIESTPFVLTLDTNLVFDIERISTDKIYELLNLYGKFEGDEGFNALLSLIKTFAGDKLGPYATLLDNLKSIEVTYDGEGGLYLIPTTQDNVQVTVLKVRLTDIVDLILGQVNVYNLVSGANQDLVSFKKTEGSKQGDYTVEIILNDETNEEIRNGVAKFLEDPTYSLIKALINYKDFDSIKIMVTVANNVVKSLDASFNYLQEAAEEGQQDTVKALLTVHLDAESKTFDFDSKIALAKETYEVFNSVAEIKERLATLTKYVYLNKDYLANLQKAKEDYEELSEAQKNFVGKDLINKLEAALNDVTKTYAFLEEYKKYDLNNLTNETILKLLIAFKDLSSNNTLLKGEIGEEAFNKLVNLGDYVDYTVFDNTLTKFEGDDETTWGLTNDEIIGLKLLLDIASYSSTVSGQLFLKLILAGKTLTVDDLTTKINNLYNGLQS